MQQFEKHLQQLLPQTDFPYGELFESARYSLGGKHLRPHATLLTTEALGGDVDLALTPACAIEMIHTYSLIHDDLPCMDDSDERRGKAALHKVVPEAHALLTGSFLLTFAFEVLGKAGLSPETRSRLTALLAERAGGHGLLGGQLMDLHHQSGIDINTLRMQHQKKTGALIAASVEFGGIVAGAPDDLQKVLLRLGTALGLAYQIRDDIADVEEDVGKRSYATLLGVDKAQEALAHLKTEIDQELANLPPGMQQVSQLFL
jgi:geranylgeranyl diphosphate synthase, type II